MAELLVVQFLVPIYDRKGKPYARSVHKRLRRELEELFDGWNEVGIDPDIVDRAGIRQGVIAPDPDALRR